MRKEQARVPQKRTGLLQKNIEKASFQKINQCIKEARFYLKKGLGAHSSEKKELYRQGLEKCRLGMEGTHHLKSDISPAFLTKGQLLEQLELVSTEMKNSERQKMCLEAIKNIKDGIQGCTSSSLPVYCHELGSVYGKLWILQKGKEQKTIVQREAFKYFDQMMRCDAQYSLRHSAKAIFRQTIATYLTDPKEKEAHFQRGLEKITRAIDEPVALFSSEFVYRIRYSILISLASLQKGEERAKKLEKALADADQIIELNKDTQDKGPSDRRRADIFQKVVASRLTKIFDDLFKMKIMKKGSMPPQPIIFTAQDNQITANVTEPKTRIDLKNIFFKINNTMPLIPPFSDEEHTVAIRSTNNFTSLCEAIKYGYLCELIAEKKLEYIEYSGYKCTKTQDEYLQLMRQGAHIEKKLINDFPLKALDKLIAISQLKKFKREQIREPLSDILCAAFKDDAISNISIVKKICNISKHHLMGQFALDAASFFMQPEYQDLRCVDTICGCVSTLDKYSATDKGSLETLQNMLYIRRSCRVITHDGSQSGFFPPGKSRGVQTDPIPHKESQDITGGFRKD